MANGTAPVAEGTSLEFPAIVFGDNNVSCAPPAVLAAVPALLRFSPDGKIWPGVAGVAGFPISYIDLVQLAFSRRPYIAETVGHLLVRTHPMLCEAGFQIENVTLPSGHSLMAGVGQVAGDRPLPFNLTGLPATVNEDVQVTVTITGKAVVTPLRFARAAPDPAVLAAVQVDHATKTLLVGGSPFRGGGGYAYNGYSGQELMELAAKLPTVVAAGARLGLMRSLPVANASVQAAFFAAAARAGFKVLWPLAPANGTLSTVQAAMVQRIRREEALLGWHICDDCCLEYGADPRQLAAGYDKIKELDPHHITVGAVRCPNPWMFSDVPAVQGPLRGRTLLALDLPALVPAGGGGGGSGWGAHLRAGLWASPLAGMLQPAQLSKARAYPAELWAGVADAEAYFSLAGPVTPTTETAGWTTALGRYMHELADADPAGLGTFGDTRLSAVVQYPADGTLMARAWYRAADSTAYLVAVNSGGGPRQQHYNGTVVQTFNDRLVFSSFSGTLGLGSAMCLAVAPDDNYALP